MNHDSASPRKHHASSAKLSISSTSTGLNVLSADSTRARQTSRARHKADSLSTGPASTMRVALGGEMQAEALVPLLAALRSFFWKTLGRTNVPRVTLGQDQLHAVFVQLQRSKHRIVAEPSKQHAPVLLDGAPPVRNLTPAPPSAADVLHHSSIRAVPTNA